MKGTAAGGGPRRRFAVVPVVAALLGLGTSAAFGATAGKAAAQVKPTVSVAKTYVGPLLVDKTGYTVYMFMRDKPNKDICRTIKGCERDWPAVTTVGKPVVGPGVKRSLLGTIPYQGKVRELTYNGHPLHTYRFDTGPRSVINIGNRQFHGAWYALNANGRVVK
ncbi:MAG TPA: hypothetical protein VHB69_00915 [Mycobacteriales bacterium]|nr:hypothetical protein [Mycobacteriales bacterium]